MAAALSSDPVDAFLGADPTSKARPGDDASVDAFLKFDHAAPAAPAAASVTPAPAQSGEQFGPADPRAQEGPFAALGAQWAGLGHDPRYTFGNILPIARNNDTGTLSLAIPNMLFELADAQHRATDAGLAADPQDLLSVASAGVGGGLIKGARFGTAETIRPAVQDAIARGEASNALAARAAPPQLAAPTEVPMAALTGGKLAEAASGNNVVQLPTGNRLAQAVAEPGASAAPPVQTPTTAPPRKLLPVRTATQADAEADRILQHFAGNGSTEINTTSAIPGSQPTLSRAIVGGNPGISGLEDRMSQMFPNDFVANDARNQTARADRFQEIAGTPANLTAAETARDAAFEAAEPKVFGPDNAKPTDPSHVIAKIDEILASREGQRDVVAAALQKVRDKIVGKNGETLIDPDQLYGVRKAINDSISPKAAGTASDARQAARQLMTVRDVLDTTIEKGAPGFRKLIGDYETASGPINGMQYLQNARLTDAFGKIQLGKLNTTIEGLERQQAMPGARLADGVTAQQLANLKTLRDDFRIDNKRKLGKPAGSDTVQNFGTNSILSVLSHPAIGALGLTHTVANPMVGLAAMAARHGVVKIGDKGQAMVMEALRRKLLNPEDARSAFRAKR